MKKPYDAITGLGFPFEEGRINQRKFYPIRWVAVSLSVIKGLFDYDDKKIQEIGEFQAKYSSSTTRVFMRYFLSLGRSAKEAPKIWRRYYTLGNFSVVESSEEKKYRIDRLENFSLHPIFYQHFKGYLSGLLEMVVQSRVSCRETKCVHQGDKYHTFLLKW